MKIKRIEAYQVDLPYAGGVYRLSGGRTYESFDATFVRIVTDTGLDGWGESTPFGSTYIAAHARGVRAGLEELAPAVLGMDPRQLDRINDAMDMALMGHHHAKTPIDVACWDVFGKAAGMPVCDLLGGRIPGKVAMISSIGSDTPEAMRANVARHREMGFMGHSVKIGAEEAEGGPMIDAERIQACLADRRPGEWFLADANNGMTPEHALRLLSLLPEGLDFVLEAPCPTWRETLSLRQRCRVPILLDELVQSEEDIIHAIDRDACDGVGLKISKQGGLTRTRRQREIARAAGLVASVQDTTGSDIAFAAILHMAQSTPRHMLRQALDTRSMVSVTTAAFDAPLQDGGAEAPDAPGLGVTPDMDVMGDPVAVWEA
ncbi:mandelate racemase/muconate lactonizing enzyme family protein [Pelagimonas sp. KU-00592-HH]|uniref:mandelate racemase/muconate lactonizing enzyme family protein n=1 Tax=Pelagimonas sp. KU-00592-HH TaxID=3127651 RepID=UPI003101C9E7